MVSSAKTSSGSLRHDPWFWVILMTMTFGYTLFLLLIILSLLGFATRSTLVQALMSPEIQYATGLSLVSCTVTALLSVLIAIPSGYLLTRGNFKGKNLLETLLDIPIVLPPMVLGLCLLIFFQTAMGQVIEGAIPFTYTVYGVILAQLVIGGAFAIRTMRGAFEHISFRPEDVALTLGCTRWQALRKVTLPAARKGCFAAASVAWARSLGEFGPILVFAGATRMKTEVLPTSVWLELSVGNLEASVAVSLLLVVLAMAVLVSVRLLGESI